MDMTEVFEGFDVDNPVVVIMGNDRDAVEKAMSDAEETVKSDITDDVVFASKTIEKRLEHNAKDMPPLTLMMTVGEHDLDSLEYVHLDHIIDKGISASVGAIVGMVVDDDNIVDVAHRSGGMKRRVLSRALLFDTNHTPFNG